LINRVFSKGLKLEIFPNFNQWAKKNSSPTNKRESKKDYDMAKLKMWIQVENPEKLSNEIDNINKKFYC